jgi:tetratricopeptide (TPR) repeat protein
VADEPLTARQAAVAADLDGDAVSAALPVLSELPLLDVGVGPEPTFAFASSRDARILRDRLPEEAAGPIARRLLDAFGDGLSASARVRLYPAVGRTADAVRPALQVAIAELDGGACERAVSRLAPLVAAAPDLSLWGHDHGRLLLVQALAVAQAHPADPAVGRLCTEAAPLVDDPTDRVRRSYGLGLHAAALGRAPEARRLFGEAAEAAGDPAIDEQVRADVWFAAAEAAESGGDGGGASRRWARLEAAPGDRPATAAARAEARLRRLWLAADFTGAWAAGLEAVDAYVAVDDAIRWARAAAALAEVGLELGAVSESLSRVRVAGRRARQLDTPLPAARLGLAEAGLELALGRLGRAQLLVEDVESALPAAAPLALHVEAELLAARVAAATAPEASGRVDAVARKAERVGMTRVVRVAQASRAAALAAQGRTQLAAEEFARVVEHLRGTGDGATLVRVLRARVRALGHLIDPDALVRPLRGWPGLPDARPLRLDLARARAAFRRAQLLDPSEADAEAASIEAAWRAGCDVEEREALRLSCG